MDHTTNQPTVHMGGAVKLHPAVTAVTATLPPMTLAQWYRLPAVVRYFHPWERASQPLVIDPQTKGAIEPDQGGAVKLQPPGR